MNREGEEEVERGGGGSSSLVRLGYIAASLVFFLICGNFYIKLNGILLDICSNFNELSAYPSAAFFS